MVMLPVAFLLAAVAQTDNAGGGASPAFGSIATPRPINPATDTTNPSARATQTLNPYLGGTAEGKVVDGESRISLEEAIARGLRLTLGLIDSQQADAGVRADREHALSQLLPEISARAAELGAVELQGAQYQGVSAGGILVAANHRRFAPKRSSALKRARRAITAIASSSPSTTE